MSPVDTAISQLSRAVRSFHPASMPALSRGHYRRELLVWSVLPVALGAVEGGVTGVLAKNVFEDAVGPAQLNMAVGILSGAPAFANIASFLWASLAHGRNKIRFLTTMQLLTIAFIALIAFAPVSASGLVILTVGAVGARLCWSGVVTLRSTVWRANYPRNARATLAGKLASVQAIVMASTAMAIGLLIERDPALFRAAYPAAALLGLLGALVYSGMRMRGHRALVLAERSEGHHLERGFAPLRFMSTLRDDVRFRRYMICMFIFGTGNLMVTAPLIVILKDHFTLTQPTQVAIAATIPLLVMPASIPFWAKLLDRMHIVQFRAVHSWAFVSSIVLVLTGCVLGQVWLLFLAAIIKGVAFGGGVLGWNLGHHDFAPVERASQYMGAHVTLTGIRGVFAPVVGVAVYQWLESMSDGAGSWVFALCLALSLTGAIGFLRMAKKMPITEPEHAPPPAR